MCPETLKIVSRPGMQEIAQAVSLLLAETDRRRNEDMQDMLDQFNEILQKIAAELDTQNRKIEEQKASLMAVCLALRGEQENVRETRKETNDGDSAGNADSNAREDKPADAC